MEHWSEIRNLASWFRAPDDLVVALTRKCFLPNIKLFQMDSVRKCRVAGSYPFKAKTTSRAHTDAGLGLHLYGRCGSAIHQSGYAASQT